MWYVVTTHQIPRFETFDARGAIEVKGVQIGCPGEKRIGEKMYSAPDMILNGAQAISVLEEKGVPGFPTKKAAKEIAMAQGLKSFKYLKVSHANPLKV